VAQFPRVRCRQLIAALEQLGYVLDRQKGSHRHFKAPGKARITISHADGDDMAPGLCRKVLTREAGLTEEEAIRLLGGRR
jgi:predicted RNA binding protein YcfA (HicA-like mRNA interferase family)